MIAGRFSSMGNAFLPLAVQETHALPLHFCLLQGAFRHRNKKKIKKKQKKITTPPFWGVCGIFYCRIFAPEKVYEP